MKLLKALFTYIFICVVGSINAQNTFNFNLKAGPILPVGTVYKGLDNPFSDSITYHSKVGYKISLESVVSLTNKAKIGINFNYEYAAVSFRQFVTYPEDVLTSNRSHINDDYRIQNLSMGVFFNLILYKKLTLNLGPQFNFPVGYRDGYVWLATSKQRDLPFTSVSRKSTQLNSSLEIPFFRGKKIAYTINPGFSYILGKEGPSKYAGNELRNYYFSLLFGIHFDGGERKARKK